MTSHVVIRDALWSRPLISGCLFSVAVSFAFPPFPSPFPPLINLNEILVLHQFQCSNTPRIFYTVTVYSNIIHNAERLTAVACAPTVK